MSKKIPYGKQHITEEDIQAVVKVLKSDFLTQGPTVLEFEKAYAKYVGARYAVAVNNGTAALHLACLALNLQPNQKIITTPISFVATANCAQYCGAQVEFVDIDPNSYLLDLNKVEDLLKKSKPNEFAGIIPVDFAGLPLPMQDFKSLAQKYNLWIIEDSCHAVGAEYQDQSGKWHTTGNGLHAECSIFSFHPVKHIATGEGGMVTTNSEEIYKKMLRYRTHGVTKDPNEMKKFDGPWYYEMQNLGYNYRISDILCALGLSQLSRMKEKTVRLRKLAKTYDEHFAKIQDIKIQQIQDHQRHAYHLYVIETSRRNDLFSYLQKNDVIPQVHYIPIYHQPYYHRNVKLDCAEKYYERAMSLPMYSSMSDDDQMLVIDLIKIFFQGK